MPGKMGTPTAAPRKRSLRVSYLLPATVAAALVSSGCVAAPSERAAPSTSLPPTALTTLRPTTAAAPPTTTVPAATTPAPTTTSADIEPTDVAICLDPETNVRVDDDLCDADEDTYSRFWLHHSSALIYPAVGAVVGLALGSFIRPTAGRVLDRGVPTSGGRVLRGGFGGHLPSGGS
ncbi:hypothetical protein ABZ412_26765 [Nocardia sp. NPDC005746]|uniref:hypothetical protein n=1 Tax=Nocardia sp. NPDC005746 TaxID=3157062 RepID=UPI0033F3221F